jgi:hypothetical protein
MLDIEHQQGDTQMNRQGKTAQGSHEYQISEMVTACMMGNNQWTLFRRNDDGSLVDTGIDCKTLAAARKYACERGWKGAH